MGNYNNRPVAFGNKFSRGMVYGNHILAARGRSKLGEETPSDSKHIKHQQDGGHHCQNDAERRDARTRQDCTHERQREENAPNHAPEAWGIEFLNVDVHVMLSHEVGDGLGGLELFLAVGRGDANLVLQVVHIIMCHGHAVHPPLVTRPPWSRECAYTLLSIRLEGPLYHPGTSWTVFCAPIPPQPAHMFVSFVQCFSTSHVCAPVSPDAVRSTIV
jgi:hypothetical protein